MPDQLPIWVLLAWPPIILVAARAIGPRRASIVAILGGYLFLPRNVHADWLMPLTVEKRTMPGLAALLAILVFDRKALGKLRPSWVDLPMLALVLIPMAGPMARGFAKLAESAEQSWMNLTGWAIPYLVGRLYFSQESGPRRLLGAIAVAGLIYVPICGFETIAGPRYYLSGLLYGTQFVETMVDRLGGFRPEAFLGNGLEVAGWMALTTVAAAWLFASRSGWKPAGLPAWTSSLVATVLGLMTLACRGVYGYALLGIGLVATLFTTGLGIRFLLGGLFLLPPAYMVARSSGAWDAHQLRDLARKAGREGTIAMRLDAEATILREAPQTGLILGLGGKSPDWSVDGWWVDTLKCGGVSGLIILYVTFLLPAGLVIFGPHRRFPARSAESGLALLVVLHMIDSLQNTSLYASTPLIDGALAGVFLAGRVASPARPTAGRIDPASPRRSVPAPDRPSRRSALIALGVTIVVLAAVEVIGQVSREPSAPGSPAPKKEPTDR